MRLQQTQLLQALLASLLAGLGLGRFGFNDWLIFWIVGSLLLVLGLKKHPLLLIGLILLGLNIGLARGHQVLLSFSHLSNYYQQTVQVSGRLEDDPSITDRYQTEFHLNNLNLNGEPVKGRVRIRGFPAVKLNRGDMVWVKGRLRPALGNRQGQISFAEIELLAKNQSGVERIRRQFMAGAYTALPEPEASLGLGFLIGLRSLLPSSIEDALAITGLTHIVAVSGYNLTILVRFTRRLLAAKSKYLATAAALALVAIFIAATGLSPSIFRAAVVSLISLGAWYYGRPLKPGVVILAAAAITALINPAYLWYDIGWYLSFLAFFGILVLAPAISARCFSKPPNALVQLLIETLSAQVLTLPLILAIFARLSAVSLPANLLILPLIPVSMSLTLIGGLGGWLVPTLAGWLAWPAAQLLNLIVTLTEFMARVPGASIDASLSVWQAAVAYAAIAIVIMGLRRHPKREVNNLTIVD